MSSPNNDFSSLFDKIQNGVNSKATVVENFVQKNVHTQVMTSSLNLQRIIFYLSEHIYIER